MRLFFSVIIPTRDRPAALGQCLRALSRLDYPREAFEVIVVDDGSSRPIQPILDPVRSQMQVRLLRQENAGPASARNLGAAVARGDWLVFLDDDCEPSSGWLGALDAARPSADVVLGGVTLNGLRTNRYSIASQQLLDYLYEYFFQLSSPFRFFASNNLAVAARRFQRLGGFDSRFPIAAGEDREFCSRWLQSGGRLIRVPEAVVKHAHVLSLRSFLRQHFHYGQGAFTYDWLRGKQNSHRLRLQPFSFYTNLFRFPWRTENGWNAWVGAVLLVLSQAANTAGFLYQGTHDAVRHIAGTRYAVPVDAAGSPRHTDYRG
jgi:glycosyltransferase involved in cell wall biosynthesis